MMSLRRLNADARVAQSSRRSRRPITVAAAAEVFDGRNAAQPNNRNPRPENVEGSFFVDHTCIDCDTCRMMAPDTFSRVGEQSAVHQQPTDTAGRVEALKALLSCPTFSIHARERSAEELRAAQQGLPALVPGTSNVYANGWRSVDSFACESYLIVRPQGNVMVDSPRFNPVLAKRLQELGGVKYIFLTHKDDVCDHKKWAEFFKCPRILHSLEVVPDTQEVEIKLEGEGPWTLPDGGEDVTLIFTPGHTDAHVVLYYGPDKALLTGDHLSAGHTPGEDLYVFTRFNWFSVPIQLDSVAKLLQYDWLRVLPGHGRPAFLRDAAHRLEAVSKLLQRHNHSTDALQQQAAPTKAAAR